MGPSGKLSQQAEKPQTCNRQSCYLRPVRDRLARRIGQTGPGWGSGCCWGTGIFSLSTIEAMALRLQPPNAFFAGLPPRFKVAAGEGPAALATAEASTHCPPLHTLPFGAFPRGLFTTPDHVESFCAAPSSIGAAPVAAVAGGGGCAASRAASLLSAVCASLPKFLTLIPPNIVFLSPGPSRMDQY